MKRIRIIGLAVVAVLAMSAVASASASANACSEGKGTLPCFTTATTFTSTSGKGTLETKGGTKVTCSSDTNTGSITGEKTFEKVLVTFKGCESSGFKCKTPGAAEGELKTKELSGGIGYLSASKKEVGVDLKPASGELFIEFECVGGIVKVKVRGSAIGKITPVNTKTKTFTLSFKQTKGVQEFTKFEGGATDILETSKNGGAFEQSGEETSDTVTTAAEAEIKA